MELEKVFTRRINEQHLKTFEKSVVINSKILQEDGTYLITYTTYSKISYEDLVVGLIREKYSLNEELALHRKSMFNTDNEEFTNYYAYVEDCKSRARQWIEERDNLINK